MKTVQRHINLFLILTLLFLENLVGQSLTNSELTYLNENSVDIEVDDNYSNGNWSSVLDEIGNKRIVMLGEFNHGSKEVFLSRNDLIKALFQTKSFDMMLFESGLGEMAALNLNMAKLEGNELLQGFFGGWRNQQFLDLMEFAQENHIAVEGYDVQRTGHTFTDFLEKYVNNPEDWTQSEKDFVTLKSRLSNSKTIFEDVEKETKSLIKYYSSLQKKMSNGHPILAQTLKNRVTYLTYMLAFAENKDWNARWKARDLAMSENVKWWLSMVEPDQKVIIVGHNFHIAKFNENEEVMGEFLLESYKKDLYVLGVFAGEGSYANNSGVEENMSPADSASLDIKHVISLLDRPVSFLPIPGTQTPEINWMFDDITVNDTFIDLSSSNQLNMSKSFDGLLLLDRVSPPDSN